jgi:hypothetical protein
MADKVYPKGVRFFPKREQAPAFVKGKMIISIDEFISFTNENPQYLKEYKGVKQLELDILENEKGIYAVVNTWQKTN